MNTGEIQSLLRVNKQFKKTNHKIKVNGNHKQQHCIPLSEKLMADFKPPVNHRTDTHYRQYSAVSLEDGGPPASGRYIHTQSQPGDQYVWPSSARATQIQSLSCSRGIPSYSEQLPRGWTGLKMRIDHQCNSVNTDCNLCEIGEWARGSVAENRA